MSINRTDVIEAKLFKQGGGYHHAFGLLFNALGQFKQGRRAFKHLLAHVFGGRIKAPTHQLSQIPIQRAHWRADAHVVVVQDDQQFAIFHARVVERLKGHARRHGAVAYHGNGIAVFTLLPRGQGHAQSSGYRGARVRGTKGVVFAFASTWKTRNTPQLAQGRHAVAPTSQNFVGVRLVPHIPDHSVVRGTKHIVQGDGELYRT